MAGHLRPAKVRKMRKRNIIITYNQVVQTLMLFTTLPVIQLITFSLTTVMMRRAMIGLPKKEQQIPMLKLLSTWDVIKN